MSLSQESLLEAIGELRKSGGLKALVERWPDGVAKPAKVREGTSTWSEDDLNQINVAINGVRITKTLSPDKKSSDEDVRRDRWGRYMVVPPEGTKPIGYTRATTVAKALDDTSALMNWGKRMVAIGLAQRPDLLALVAAADPKDNKELNSLCERAAEAGGAVTRRDLGTALHKFVELTIADPNALMQVPEIYRADVQAILQVIDDAGFEVAGEYSEVMVVDDEYKIAGTADLFLRRKSDNLLRVADLKTGSSVQYGQLAWAIQLSMYANATSIYRQGSAPDGKLDERIEMPDIDTETAFILHCEPGSGSCEIYDLDIERGAQALEAAMAVRGWRREKDLLVPTVYEETGNN